MTDVEKFNLNLKELIAEVREQRELNTVQEYMFINQLNSAHSEKKKQKIERRLKGL